jgi:hypothetical protein
MNAAAPEGAPPRQIAKVKNLKKLPGARSASKEALKRVLSYKVRFAWFGYEPN